jgi:hypothetical protein
VILGVATATVADVAFIKTRMKRSNGILAVIQLPWHLSKIPRQGRIYFKGRNYKGMK